MPLGYFNDTGSDALQSAAVLKTQLEEHLEKCLPSAGAVPLSLHEAMRHAVLSPGKRVRPMLCLLVQDAAADGDREFALDCAAAVEFLHAASLVLDDMPCMDDADLRRGKLTTHRKYGESTALLAAIGLINLAYGAIARAEGNSRELRLQASAILAETIGPIGLVAGQELDLMTKETARTAAEIEEINWLKTGVLFVAAAELGALAGGLDSQRIAYAKEFARYLGLAFQTHDDILDQTASVASIGKDVLQDDSGQTLVNLAGVDAAAVSCRKHLTKANAALELSGINPEHINQLVQSVFRDLVRN